MLRFLGVPTLSSRGRPGPAIEIQGGVEYFLPVCFLLSSFFNNINTKLVFLQYSVDSKPVHKKIHCLHQKNMENATNACKGATMNFSSFNFFSSWPALLLPLKKKCSSLPSCLVGGLVWLSSRHRK